MRWKPYLKLSRSCQTLQRQKVKVWTDTLHTCECNSQLDKEWTILSRKAANYTLQNLTAPCSTRPRTKALKSESNSWPDFLCPWKKLRGLSGQQTFMLTSACVTEASLNAEESSEERRADNLRMPKNVAKLFNEAGVLDKMTNRLPDNLGPYTDDRPSRSDRLRVSWSNHPPYTTLTLLPVYHSYLEIARRFCGMIPHR